MSQDGTIAPRGEGARDPLDGRSLALSLALHAVAVVVLVWGVPALARDPIVYQTIEIRVVSAPPAPTPEPEEDVEAAPREELIVETPDEPAPEEAVEPEDAPIPVEEIPPPEPEETPPDEETPPPEDEAPPPEPEDPPTPETPAPADPEEAAEEDGGEDIIARMEGVRRDHPAYYGNIIRQINRCFRAPDAESREAVVRFTIHEDGTVTSIAMVERSGSFVFDLAAQDAIDCAGRPGRLGPLPQGYAWDVLPVQFTFRPGSSRGPPPHAEEAR